jgi:hypothetical protein
VAAPDLGNTSAISDKLQEVAASDLRNISAVTKKLANLLLQNCFSSHVCVLNFLFFVSS